MLASVARVELGKYTLAVSKNMLLTVIQGGGQHPWKSSWVIAPIVVSGVGFIGLGFWEAYAPLKYPILPPKLFVKWRE